MGCTFDLERHCDEIKELKVFMIENRDRKGLLMDTLHRAQNLFGYIPIEVQRIISQELKVPLSEVYGVVTFYSHFSLIPKGKYDIGVCMGTACYVKQAQQILDKVQEILGIGVGQTTPDRRFSISETRCLGACGLAPVMMVGEDVYGRLKEGDVETILNKYR